MPPAPFPAFIGPALLDGISYLDGGISDAVPVQGSGPAGQKPLADPHCAVANVLHAAVV